MDNRPDVMAVEVKLDTKIMNGLISILFGTVEQGRKQREMQRKLRNKEQRKFLTNDWI